MDSFEMPVVFLDENDIHYIPKMYTVNITFTKTILTAGRYTPFEEEEDDFDEFTDWVKAVRQQPTPKQRFREFISSRYAERGHKAVYNGKRK